MLEAAMTYVHRAVAPDGIEIAGHVSGQGPPLVFVHGSMADGQVEWGELLPLLTDRFTCHAPDMRGRGLSGAHPDVSCHARVRDVAAYVDSIGEPVGLVGLSAGAMLALGAAARTSTAVTALAAYEPVVFEVINPGLRTSLQDAVERMAKADDVAEGAGAFLELIANDDEQAALTADPSGLDVIGRYLPLDVAELRDMLTFTGPSPTDPATLTAITAPTLLLHGSNTAQREWFAEAVRYVAAHVHGAQVREVPHVGHLGAAVAPDVIARELTRFLAD